MLALALADLRHSLRVWIGAFVLLAVASTMIEWMAAMAAIGIANIDFASLARDMQRPDPANPNLVALGLASAAVTTGIILLTVVAITVASVGSLVIAQRRRTLALWQLAGIGDGQLATILLTQMTVLALLAALLGFVAGGLSVRGVIAYVAENGLILPSMSTRAASLGLAVGAAIGAGVSVAGMLAAVWRVRRIRAIEALHPVDGEQARMTAMRWFGLVVALGLAALVVLATVSSRTMDSASSAALLLLLSLSVLLHAGAPAFVPGAVAAWTRWVPGAHAPTWLLARCALGASSARLIGSVTPVAISVALVVGLRSVQATLTGAVSTGDTKQSLFSLIAVVGLPLIVSVVGAAVMVFMTSQQRDREVALGALAGATPAQQILQAVFESAIVVASGVVLGMICVAIVLACLQPVLIATHARGGFAVDVSALAWVIALTAAANLTACVIPTLAAQRRSFIRLIAQD